MPHQGKGRVTTDPLGRIVMIFDFDVPLRRFLCTEALQ